MSLAIVHTRAQVGIQAPLVTVEVHLSNGLPAMNMVGLPETAVKESKDRVRSAILNSNFEFPAKKITINLAPADLPKEGGRYDLAIAIGILAAAGEIPEALLKQHEFIGELALSGEVRPIRGILSAAIQTQHTDRTLILPTDNAEEASLCQGAKQKNTRSLLEVCAYLCGQTSLDEIDNIEPAEFIADHADLNEVRGQAQAKRALEITAAGKHNLIFIGPPGTGKTMLASRLPGILPPMTDQEALESAAIYSISRQQTDWLRQWKQRPFRSPHHTASGISLVGGGGKPKPGEISLAHGGILFLDELPEFSRKVLDVLREPLESGEICIARASQQVTYPARFQLVAAMNPCPCGYYGDASAKCTCTEDQVRRYQGQTSGPLLDRIDLQVEVPPISILDLQTIDPKTQEDSAAVQARVLRAWQKQTERQQCSNAQLSNAQVEAYCRLSEEDETLLRLAIEKLDLSARAYHRVLKISRTIADLDDSEHIQTGHIMEALSYRKLERYRQN
ncbi:MAG: ATP-dependent protease [Oleispira sp.]|nr:ATP-dependent protease [Oleispira sp.]